MSNHPTRRVDRTIRVVLVDDHRLFADPLGAALGEPSDLEVEGVFYAIDDALESPALQRCDVVLLDAVFGSNSDVGETVRRFRDANAALRIVVMSGHADERIVIDSIIAGACGFIYKGASMEELWASVRGAAEGKTPVAAEAVAILVRHLQAPITTLTGREEEVALAVAEGLSNTEIAGQMNVAVTTVKTHLAAIFTKLGVDDRVAVAHWWVRRASHRGR